MVKDFYDDWSIEETCDTVTLESSHPWRSLNYYGDSEMVYTHECKNDEIVYFKVDVNLIDIIPQAVLGNV